MSKLQREGPATYILPQSGGMRVPGLVIMTDKLMDDLDIDEPLEQVRNVAFLPGIVGYSIAMPDMHWGYGFPIGGVAAMDVEEGVISPGGVGYDINCGVRLAIVPVPFKEFSKRVTQELLAHIFSLVPSGVGRGQKGARGLSDRDYKEIFENGARWSVEQGFGFSSDLGSTESHGVIEGASFDAVSEHAKERGRKQLGSIGSGNHFVEIGTVQKPYLPLIAAKWGIEEGLTYLLIHSGSRGLGHQVCTDTLKEFIHKGFAEGLPDRQLVAAPIKSPEGQRYFAGMAAAANFAFNNRQQILHEMRQSFQQVLGIKGEEIRLIYDVAHNIAKFETHVVAGKPMVLCVHRKGATRAFGPGAEELTPLFKETGQPVLVPGDMGRASHLMVGLGNPLTWCSSCHGAGRAMSRVKCRKSWIGQDVVGYMADQGVSVMASSSRTITEEMPNAYKDVDAVVEAVEEARLANRVVRLRPRLVVKG